MYRIISISVLALLLASSAFAQVEVPTPNPNVVDFSPIINQLIGVGIIIVAGVIAAAGASLRSWLVSKRIMSEQQIDALMQNNYNQAALMALSYLESILQKKDGTVDWAKLELDNPFLRETAIWMMKNWPDITEGKSLEDIIKSLFARIPSGPVTYQATGVLPPPVTGAQ
jgi:hypothetical protein